MRPLLFGALLLATLGTGIAVHAGPGDGLRERFRARLAERMAHAEDGAPATTPGEVLRYGADPAQSLAVWKPARLSAPAPLVLFVHGGGWRMGSKDNATGRWKTAHYPGEGMVFASTDYRLVPGARVEDQAADVTHALRALLDRAGALGIDRRRVVLMGHSAGAHLVALVGTDERYLREAGLSFADLGGVIAIDGAAYDVPAQMRDGPQIMQNVYRQAFGEDPARQRALSPTLQAAAPNAPGFLLLHVQRPDGVRQAEALEAALKAAGTRVTRSGFPGEGLRGHAEINRRLGDPSYAPTATVDDWLRGLGTR